MLSEAGRARIALAREQCLGDLATTLDGMDTGSMFTAPLTRVPGIWAVLHDYLGVPRRGFSQPLMLAHWQRGPRCALSDHPAVRAGLAVRGEPVAFRRYPVDHRGTLDAAAADGLAFVRARLEDDHFNDAAEIAGLEQRLDEAR